MYYPERILLAGFATYMVILILAPLEPLVDILPQSLLYVGLCVAAFIAGSRFENLFQRVPRESTLSADALRFHAGRLFWWMFSLGAFGTLLRLYEKYVLRGVAGLSGFEAREALLESSSSVFSLVGGAFYPFGYIPLFLYLGSKALPRNRAMYFMALGLFLVPALDALVLFSRSFMLVSLALIYFGASISLYQGRAFPRQLMVPMLSALGLVVFLSTLLFSIRLGEMELAILDSIFMSGYGYTIAPNAAATTVLEQGGAGAQILSSLLPLAQYYTHSFFELQILWESSPWQTHSYGSLHFFPYVKALSIFGLASLPDLWMLFPRVGIFTSFFGPLWVDFGWFGGLAMFIFGMICRRAGRVAQSGDVGAYPLYAYLCIVLFFSPVVNFVISAQGVYNLTAFTVFFVLSRKLAGAPIGETHETLPARA